VLTLLIAGAYSIDSWCSLYW